MLVVTPNVSTWFFPETDFKPVPLKRKGTPVPKNYLGAPIYPTPNQHICTGKTAKATISVAYEDSEEATIPLFAPPLLEPCTLDDLSEADEDDYQRSRSTSSTNLQVS